MSDAIELKGDIKVAFDHLAAYGAAAIGQAVTGKEVGFAWTPDLESRVRVLGLSLDELGNAVLEHAQRHSLPDSWVQICCEIPADWQANPGKKPKSASAGLFSPRVMALNQEGARAWRERKYSVLDGTAELDELDFDMIGSLGEPSYWSFSRERQSRPDYGASRWEMKTRNRGEDFMANRLRLLAAAVAGMTETEVAGGLSGQLTLDIVGKESADSRTPTGLKAPEKTDNTRAWCALWGISQMSVTHQASGASLTTAHFGSHLDGYFCLPVMTRPWTLGRLRTVLRSPQLVRVCAFGLPDQSVPKALRPSSSDCLAAWDWLEARGAPAVVRFPVHRSNNPNAPEKWAELGQIIEPGELR
ncbi:MAG: hypothetical protein LBC97_08160 [Bifidobacteriaceae bacterium]|jgi:CRISPR-associated protein Csb3|nr:hypothetical protein [Bifidobacteriaceae bacterium]